MCKGKANKSSVKGINMKELKLRASKVIEFTIEDENYKDARVLVFEGTKLIVCEELRDILHKTYKKLKDYEVTKWTTDWKVNDNDDIKTLVIFVEKVSA